MEKFLDLNTVEIEVIQVALNNLIAEVSRSDTAELFETLNYFGLKTLQDTETISRIAQAIIVRLEKVLPS
jgi:hypothetical protein